MNGRRARELFAIIIARASRQRLLLSLSGITGEAHPQKGLERISSGRSSVLRLGEEEISYRTSKAFNQ
jgi:hypothetical protein